MSADPGRNSAPTQNAVTAALQEAKRAAWGIVVFSGVVNLLVLAGPLYMLQVYDRVLTSRSVPTLVALSLFVTGAYLLQGVIEVIRARVMSRVANLVDDRITAATHRASLAIALRSRFAEEAYQPVRDLDQLRGFLGGAGPTALTDLPWMPVFLLFCFLIHPLLGVVALAGGVVLFGLALVTERVSRDPARALSAQASKRMAMVEANRRNSESVAAMGMTGALQHRWHAVNDRFTQALRRSGDLVTAYSIASKICRTILQSLMLGVGAYLVIAQKISPGAMIAASIMMGRALAPVEVAIANWRGFISARQSYRRLSDVMARLPASAVALALPAPSKSFAMESAVVAAPGAARPIVGNIDFRLAAGEALGIIGPSGAGKTSLVRAAVGVWPLLRGAVRLDGATLDQWQTDLLGRHIGFVSQSAELFEGTVAENIARMSEGDTSAGVVRAAELAGAHEMILRLPDGYETRIGEAGAILSAGQRQRIALARALYGDPFLLVLDEPTANLDREGETAFAQAIAKAKARGAIVMIVAHQPAALAECDKVLLLANGTQQAFGPRAEILGRVTALGRAGQPGPRATNVLSPAMAFGEAKP